MVYRVQITFQILKLLLCNFYLEVHNVCAKPFYHFAHKRTVSLNTLKCLKYRQGCAGASKVIVHCFWHWENILDWRKWGKKWGLEGETKNTVLLEDEGCSHFVTLLNENIFLCMSRTTMFKKYFFSVAKSSSCGIRKAPKIFSSASQILSNFLLNCAQLTLQMHSEPHCVYCS